ncbi:MAG: amidohydrolase family protein [Piscinibacter sp.]
MDRTTPVPHSAGTAAPEFAVPLKSCDAHIHIFSQRFPMAAGDTRVVPDASVEDYGLLQKRLGTSRVVVVQPSTYGTDNRCLVEALGQLGASARGVAVVDSSVADEDLLKMARAGVRGIRFNIARAGATRVEMIEPLAARIAPLGWHVQIHMEADEIAHLEPLWERLPVPVVFDHLARIPAKQGTSHPAFAVVRKLLEGGKAWVKLSGAYAVSADGAPAYGDVAPLARAFHSVRPDRTVWGSDWPHPSLKVKPDDGVLLSLLARWVPDAGLRTRILVDNAQALYGF